MAWDDDFERWFKRLWRQSGFDFDNVEKMFDYMFREMFDNIPEDLYREEKLPDGSTAKRVGPFIYGYSITLGPDGKPKLQEFGNVKRSNKAAPFGASRTALEAKGEREPLIDVTSDKETVRVIAEIPGVDKKEIKLRCSERLLTISVDSNRRYYKEVELPTEVDPKIGKAKYTNGVLEVVLTKVKKHSGETIKIE